jgi:hypothetical protein
MGRQVNRPRVEASIRKVLHTQPHALTWTGGRHFNADIYTDKSWAQLDTRLDVFTVRRKAVKEGYELVPTSMIVASKPGALSGFGSSEMSLDDGCPKIAMTTFVGGRLEATP